jgi:hypothetical protein
VNEFTLFLFGSVVFLMVSGAALGPFLYAAHRVQKGTQEQRAKKNDGVVLHLS